MTIQEQAEQLARKCSEALLRRPANSATTVAWIIETQCYLVELLEVARALVSARKQLQNIFDHNAIFQHDRPKLVAELKEIDTSLRSLREKGVEI